MAGMLNDRYTNPRMIPKSMSSDLIRGWDRFPAFAKPASAGEGRSEKIMRKHK